MSTLLIHTDRLDLVAATVEHLQAEIESSAQLGRLLNATIPDDWPPGEYDRPAIEFFRDRLMQAPAAVGWFTWYAIERAGGNRPARCVGAGGYFGPPDLDGTIEIGYSIAAPHRGQGFATEMVRALVGSALSLSNVFQVIAHVHSENLPSVKVLEHCGFSRTGATREDGELQFARERLLQR
jgi:[ribosomal protein S5]-alanine N-acetyltransferase